MTYLNNFYTFLTKYFSLHTISFLLVLLISLLLLFIFGLSKIKIQTTEHKIYSKYLSMFYLFTYICVFIAFMIYLRYKYWGVGIDLHLYSDTLLILYKKSKLLFTIVLLDGLILLILIGKIRKFFYMELRKLYIYVKYSPTYLNSLYDSQGYNKRLKRIENFFRWSLITIETKILLKIEKLINLFIGPQKENLFRIMHYREYFVTGPIFIFICCLFFYDIKYNNMVIVKVLYFLPLYIIFRIWVNINRFIFNTDDQLNHRLYEMYYGPFNLVKYHGITEQEWKIIKDYNKDGLMRPSKSISSYKLLTKFSQEQRNDMYENWENFVSAFENLRRFYPFFFLGDYYHHTHFTNEEGDWIDDKGNPMHNWVMEENIEEDKK